MNRTLRKPRFRLIPALRTYRASEHRTVQELASLPNLGSRIGAVLRARATWLNASFLTDGVESDQRTLVEQFYCDTVPTGLFNGSLRRQFDRIRDGIDHVCCSRDPLSVRLERCLSPQGVFFVAGIGPAFWSAVAQGLDPLRNPAWTAATVIGARRLGLVQRKRIWYGDLLTACQRIRNIDSRLTALHVDHFLSLVGRARGLNWHSQETAIDPVPPLIAAERAHQPLRQRLKKQGTRIAAARANLATALVTEDAPTAIAALTTVDPQLGRYARAWDPGTLLQWIAWIWHDEDPLAEVAACERASAAVSRSFTAVVLHLRHPDRFPLWDADANAGLARLADSPADDYVLYAEAIAAMSARYRLHPLEVPPVLARLAAHAA